MFNKQPKMKETEEIVDIERKIRKLAYNKVFALARPLYDNEEKCRKVTNRILSGICKSIEEADIDNVNEWIAHFTTISLYRIQLKKCGDLFTKDTSGVSAYEHNYVDEDAELCKYIGKYNNILAGGNESGCSVEMFSDFTIGQIILYELFCYEGLSVNDIEEELDIDRQVILNELVDMRKIVTSSGEIDEDSDVLELEEDESGYDELDESESEVSGELQDYEEEKHFSGKLKILCISIPSAVVILLAVIVVAKGFTKSADANTSVTIEETSNEITKESSTEEQTQATTQSQTQTTTQEETESSQVEETSATSEKTTKAERTKSGNTGNGAANNQGNSGNNAGGQGAVTDTQPAGGASGGQTGNQTGNQQNGGNNEPAGNEPAGDVSGGGADNPVNEGNQTQGTDNPPDAGSQGGSQGDTSGGSTQQPTGGSETQGGNVTPDNPAGE